jgi:phospholipid/cholesterol/gamma-HCH transport system substrate-binding protein
MKRFGDRDPAKVGLVSIIVLVVAVLIAVNFSRLPLISNNTTYRADFADSGGLQTGDIVTVAGVRVGQIIKLALHGDRVRVSFTVGAGVHLGAETAAAGKVLNPVGQEYLELAPAGPGHLRSSTVIPLSRTSVPSTFVGDLSQLTEQVGGYDIPQLVKSMQVGSQDLKGSPGQATAAVLTGLARFSKVLADRRQELATVVVQGAQLTQVLSQRSGELVSLVGQGDLVLQVLNQRRQTIQQLLAATSTLSLQLSSILTKDGTQLNSFLSSLQSLSSVLSNDSATLANAIPLLAAFNTYAANVTGSGMFADFVLPTTLIPGNVIVQCSKLLPLSATAGCRP